MDLPINIQIAQEASMVPRVLSRIVRLAGLTVLVLGLIAVPALSAQSIPKAKVKTFNVVFIPKLVGIPWFNAMEKGFKDFAKGSNINYTTSGAATADPAAQARLIEDAIAKKPDCIIVVPNDTAVIEPAMKKGMDAGILMLTQEASTVKNAYADIEFLILAKEGKDLGDIFVKNAGTKGGYAVMIGGLTNEGHNARADAIVAYLAKNYPDLKQVTSRLEGSENVQEAHDKTLQLITAYPDLIGVLYVGSAGPIGGAQAVTEKGVQKRVAIIGSAVPSQAKKYLLDGSLRASYIGNPYLIGKDSAYIIERLLSGVKLADIGNLPQFGSNTVSGKVITFHADAEVSADNADSFGF
jgi:simple sugar transport system substrate-binding protein